MCVIRAFALHIADEGMALILAADIWAIPYKMGMEFNREATGYGTLRVKLCTTSGRSDMKQGASLSKWFIKYKRNHRRLTQKIRAAVASLSKEEAHHGPARRRGQQHRPVTLPAAMVTGRMQ